MSQLIEFLQKSHKWSYDNSHRVWVPAHSSDETGVFSEELQAEMFGLEDQSFWFVHRSRIISNFLSNDVLSLVDLGGGNGVVAAWLKKDRGTDTMVIEPGMQGARNAAKRGLTSVQGRLEDLPFPDGSIPHIGLFDVLEHINDDHLFLSQIFKKLSPGGSLSITVPAFSWLWCQEDVLAQHIRRYSKKDLVELLEKVGFRVQRASYMFFAPLIALLFISKITLSTQVELANG